MGGRAGIRLRREGQGHWVDNPRCSQETGAETQSRGGTVRLLEQKTFLLLNKDHVTRCDPSAQVNSESGIFGRTLLAGKIIQYVKV